MSTINFSKQKRKVIVEVKKKFARGNVLQKDSTSMRYKKDKNVMSEDPPSIFEANSTTNLTEDTPFQTYLQTTVSFDTAPLY